jgi:hypothetical protein
MGHVCFHFLMSHLVSPTLFLTLMLSVASKTQRCVGGTLTFLIMNTDPVFTASLITGPCADAEARRAEFQFHID